MIERERFKALWNGTATIIFLAGIFLGLQIWGYSAFLVAIFLWVIGGTVTTMIYGSSGSKTSSSTTINSVNAAGPPVRQTTVCPSCGAKLESNSSFCAECGTAVEPAAK
jgi:hypothetical protein